MIISDNEDALKELSSRLYSSEVTQLVDSHAQVSKTSILLSLLVPLPITAKSVVSDTMASRIKR